MRKLIKSILPEVGIEDLKIRSRGDNRCESANEIEMAIKFFAPRQVFFSAPKATLSP
jgi:hypothetical protein